MSSAVMIDPASLTMPGALMEGYYFKQKKLVGNNCLSGNLITNIEKKANIYFDSSIVYHELCNILNGGISIGKGLGNPEMGPFESSCFADPYGLYNPFQPGGGGYDPYSSYNNGGNDFGVSPGDNFDIGDGTGVNPFNLTIAAKFLNFTKETSTTFTLTFGYNLELGGQHIEDPRIGEEYLKLMESPGRFRASCGDHFIYNMKRGAFAFVSVKIDAGTKMRKSEISSQLNLNIGLLSLGTALKNLRQKYGTSIKMDIRGIQNGGDANMLSEVIGDGQLCSDVDHYGCKDIITSLHRYFSETLPAQFNQIDYDNSGINSKSVALKYATKSYCMVTGKVPETCKWPDITDSFNEIDKDLTFYREELKKSNKALSTLLLEKKKFHRLSKYRMEMMYNTKILEQAGEECMQDHARCQTTSTEVKGLLRPKKENMFKGLPDTKLEHHIAFCIDADKPFIETVEIKLRSRMDNSLGNYRITNWDAFDFEQGDKRCFKRPLTQQVKDLEIVKMVVKGPITDFRGRVAPDKKCGLGKKKLRSKLSWRIKELTILREGKKPLNIGGHNFFEKNKCRIDQVTSEWETRGLSFTEL